MPPGPLAPVTGIKMKVPAVAQEHLEGAYRALPKISERLSPASPPSESDARYAPTRELR